MPINVTKSYLPPQSLYQKYLDQIWQSGQLTNNGALVQKLEENLENYLGVKHLQYVTNGTIALRLALRSLELKGEIITTPYSYIATTSAILWENLHPIFVDIDPNTLCINADLIEGNITEKTSAILATHVYGIPCEVKKIETIAQKHNLKVIYDAAHAFGVKLDGESLYNFGNISTASFHATKVYHTIEGGALITKNTELSEHISLLKAFGHQSDEHYHPGINGKNSEFHAAMGLCNLESIDELISQRKIRFELYHELLSKLNIRTISVPENIEYNYAYLPVFLKDHKQMSEVKNALESENIFPRRYFYPSLDDLPYYETKACDVSRDLSQRVLCLPLYPDLDISEIKRIVSIISKIL